jgi:hypothetical protein
MSPGSAAPGPVSQQPHTVQTVKIDGSRKKNHVVLNLKLRTSPVAVSDRVVAVSDAFGVGVDDQKEFTIFDNVQLGYDDDDLI